MKNLFFPLLTALIVFSSCNQPDEKEGLAKKYCSTCHLFPAPSLLDKKTWQNGVLPEMAFRMGLDISKLPGTNSAELNEILKAIPPEPLVSKKEWESIRDYYANAAPDTLLTVPTNNLSPLRQFEASIVKLPIEGKTMLTLIRADPSCKNIFIGTRKGELYRFRKSLILEDSFQLESPPSDITFDDNGNKILSCMGIMDPNDRAAGSVVALAADGKNSVLLVDSIKRPVHIQSVDLNNDQEQDLLVSAFGNFTGALLAFEKNGGQYHQHVLHNFPGTRMTIVRDFNNDGLQDVLALIAQGDERIALFTNRGKFKFSYQVLLKFPPVYGSSYLELRDFNSDGKEDILYTNGDNADYSSILKPYHGVRIFLNDGQNHFSQSWFYPMHGASMARAVDFDEDGDLDIAAISFFPDFEKHPEHSFLYFENDGGKFTAFQTPLAASSRWITMEVADIDDDQDDDLILGALAFPMAVPDSLYEVWGKNQTSLLILRNNLVKVRPFRIGHD
ncbi:MAG TPA: VCBS repeat-containing protein [Chryseosolibacter sp.]|nr:VCBS repeat-containing protein [Chryseosolibacter sp.]